MRKRRRWRRRRSRNICVWSSECVLAYVVAWSSSHSLWWCVLLACSGSHNVVCVPMHTQHTANDGHHMVSYIYMTKCVNCINTHTQPHGVACLSTSDSLVLQQKYRTKMFVVPFSDKISFSSRKFQMIANANMANDHVPSLFDCLLCLYYTIECDMRKYVQNKNGRKNRFFGDC